ncbi:MAG: hypothetical protein ACI8RZ_004515 [Myxococcota bacterium]|jgi:hypothetical protein
MTDLLWLSVLLLGACTPAPSEDSPAFTPEETGGGETVGSDTASSDTADSDTSTVASGQYDDGRRWFVTRLAGEAPWGVVIVAPPEGDDAAPVPVVLAALGGLSAEPACLNAAPEVELIADTGAVTLRLMGATQCCAGVCGEAEEDQGGPRRQAGMQSMARLAAGTLADEGGRNLGAITGLTIDTDRQLMLLSSAVTLTGLSAIAASPVDFSALDGVIIYEPPILPAMVTKYLGLLPWDRNTQLDHSGSGCTWDDGASPWYRPDDCAGTRCRIDDDQLAWAPEVSAADLIVYPEITPGGLAATGMLFLDGDGDGLLQLSTDGHPDRNGDGFIGEDEDLPLPGLPNFSGSSERYWHPDTLLEAAIARGVLDAAAWPPHLMSAEAATLFWQERDGYGALDTVTAALPELRWLMLASSRDHGVPLCSRPHIVNPYMRLRTLGADVGLNPTLEALSAVSGSTIEGYTPLRNGPLTKQTVVNYTPPPEVTADALRTAAVVELLGE